MLGLGGSELLTATNSGTLLIGVFVQSTGSGFLPGLPNIDGTTLLAGSVDGNSAFALFAVGREGLHLHRRRRWQVLVGSAYREVPGARCSRAEQGGRPPRT